MAKQTVQIYDPLIDGVYTGSHEIKIIFQIAAEEGKLTSNERSVIADLLKTEISGLGQKIDEEINTSRYFNSTRGNASNGN